MDSSIASTSFIPKTRLTAPSFRRKGLGIGFFISCVLLLISLGLLGGAYLYKQSLQKSVDDDIASLGRAKNSLEPGLIDELNRLNFSINAAKSIFTQHAAVSQIFKIISEFTLKDVRFLNFNFNMTGKNPSVVMSGEAKGYTSIALQANLFRESDAISQMTFSNFGLKEAGKVSFNVEIILNPPSLIYKP